MALVPKTSTSPQSVSEGASTSASGTVALVAGGSRARLVAIGATIVFGSFAVFAVAMLAGDGRGHGRLLAAADGAVAGAASPRAERPPHPHPVRRLTLRCVHGDTTLAYRSVHFNADRVGEVDVGDEWHLAFATVFTNESVLRADTVYVPPGRWSATVRRGAQDSFRIVLRDLDLVAELRRTARAMRRAPDSERLRLESRLERLRDRHARETLLLPAHRFPADDSEHLHMTLVAHGHEVRGTDDARPVRGTEFEWRITFGHLRCGVRFEEKLEATAEDDTPREIETRIRDEDEPETPRRDG